MAQKEHYIDRLVSQALKDLSVENGNSWEDLKLQMQADAQLPANLSHKGYSLATKLKWSISVITVVVLSVLGWFKYLHTNDPVPEYVQPIITDTLTNIDNTLSIVTITDSVSSEHNNDSIFETESEPNNLIESTVPIHATVSTTTTIIETTPVPDLTHTQPDTNKLTTSTDTAISTQDTTATTDVVIIRQPVVIRRDTIKKIDTVKVKIN